MIGGMDVEACLIAVGNDHSMNRSRCPGGRELVTLEDAGDYITKLPKAEHEATIRVPRAPSPPSGKHS
jgi:hypothetical protein